LSARRVEAELDGPDGAGGAVGVDVDEAAVAGCAIGKCTALTTALPLPIRFANLSAVSSSVKASMSSSEDIGAAFCLPFPFVDVRLTVSSADSSIGSSTGSLGLLVFRLPDVDADFVAFADFVALAGFAAFAAFAAFAGFGAGGRAVEVSAPSDSTSMSSSSPVTIFSDGFNYILTSVYNKEKIIYMYLLIFSLDIANAAIIAPLLNEMLFKKTSDVFAPISR